MPRIPAARSLGPRRPTRAVARVAFSHEARLRSSPSAFEIRTHRPRRANASTGRPVACPLRSRADSPTRHRSPPETSRGAQEGAVQRPHAQGEARSRNTAAPRLPSRPPTPGRRLRRHDPSCRGVDEGPPAGQGCGNPDACRASVRHGPGDRFRIRPGRFRVGWRDRHASAACLRIGWSQAFAPAGRIAAAAADPARRRSSGTALPFRSGTRRGRLGFRTGRRDDTVELSGPRGRTDPFRRVVGGSAFGSAVAGGRFLPSRIGNFHDPRSGARSEAVPGIGPTSGGFGLAHAAGSPDVPRMLDLPGFRPRFLPRQRRFRQLVLAAEAPILGRPRGRLRPAARQ